MRSISCSVICVRGTMPHLAGCSAVRCMVSFAVRVRFPRVPLKNAMALRMGTPHSAALDPISIAFSALFALVLANKNGIFLAVPAACGPPFFGAGPLGERPFGGLERGGFFWAGELSTEGSPFGRVGFFLAFRRLVGRPFFFGAGPLGEQPFGGLERGASFGRGSSRRGFSFWAGGFLFGVSAACGAVFFPLVRGPWGSSSSADLKGGRLLLGGGTLDEGGSFRANFLLLGFAFIGCRAASFFQRVTQSSRAGTSVRSLAPAFFVCGEHWRGALCGGGGWFAVGAGEALLGGPAAQRALAGGGTRAC